jgi:hypothetical protein
MDIRIDYSPSCANLQCSNVVGEGRFTLTTIGIGIAGAITLLLCGPCAAAQKG